MVKLSKYQKELVGDLAFDAYQNRGQYEDELPLESIEKWVLKKFPTDALAQQEYLKRNPPDIPYVRDDVVQLRKKSKSTKPKRKTCSCKKK